MNLSDKKQFLMGWAGLAVLSLLLAGCGERANQANYFDLNDSGNTEAIAALPIGSYSMELSINDFSLENLAYRPYLRDYVGHWELDLTETGIFLVTNNNFTIEGLYRVTSDELIFYGTNWLNSCFHAEKSNEVDYHWSGSNNRMNLISLEDDCFDRSLILIAHSWTQSSLANTMSHPQL